MFSKFNIQKKGVIVFMVILGSIMVAGGLLAGNVVDMDKHNLQMALGFITGLGASFLLMGIISIFRLIILSKDKLKQIEIEKQDERNMQIMGRVFTVSYYISYFILTLLIFAFFLMGYRIPAYLCTGAICIQGIAVFLVKKYFDKRM